jgi:hypothetical protein
LLKARTANEYNRCVAIDYEAEPENPLEDIEVCLVEA